MHGLVSARPSVECGWWLVDCHLSVTPSSPLTEMWTSNDVRYSAKTWAQTVNSDLSRWVKLRLIESKRSMQRMFFCFGWTLQVWEIVHVSDVLGPDVFFTLTWKRLPCSLFLELTRICFLCFCLQNKDNKEICFPQEKVVSVTILSHYMLFYLCTSVHLYIVSYLHTCLQA